MALKRSNRQINNKASIKELLDYSNKELSIVSQSAFLEAELLMCFCLKQDRVYLHTHLNEQINKNDFLELVKRRKNHEPIEYITNNASFYSNDFFVDKRVLIPRPETEILIDKANKLITNNNIKQMVEIGTGSGIISIILKKMHPQVQIIATDISKDALNVAKINAKKHKVDIDFKHTCLLDGIDEVELIVSNPPYIAKNTILDKNIINFEPHIALFGGKSGDEILKQIIQKSITKHAKYLMCEIGHNQKQILEKLFMSLKLKYSFFKDLSKLDRGFLVEF